MIEHVSNAVALFCCDLGATTIYLKFQTGSIILFLVVLLFSNSYQFVLLNTGACHFGDIAMRKTSYDIPLLLHHLFLYLAIKQFNSKINLYLGGY